MKQFILLGLVLGLNWGWAQQPTQGLTQTVKGTAIDEWSGRPLEGVRVQWEGSGKKSVTTDASGRFTLTGVAIGRQNFTASKEGYEAGGASQVEITSSKEVELEIRLKERLVQLNDVVVTSDKKTQAINRSAVVSARQFSVEDAVRYAGSRNDPSRMAQNFAGVSGSNDARNDIIVRGNSPAGILWRLEGIDIPNPNHYSTLGATGGPVTILNTNTLKNSDFMSGAFPASYGNAMAGVFDLRMRNGNTDKREYLGQMGFNGFEFGTEGPISRKAKSSYLFNYRYSMVATLVKMGINVGTGAATPYFQDMNFKINIPTSKAGTFSLFGFGGNSRIAFDALDKDNLYSTNDGSLRDRNFVSNSGFMGFTHTYNYGANTTGKALLGLSGAEATYKEIFYNTNPEQTAFYKKNTTTKYSFGYTVQHKISNRNQWQVGAFADLHKLKLYNDYIPDGSTQLYNFVNINTSAILYRGYANWQHRFNDRWSSQLGAYGQYFDLNKHYNIEPRGSLKYQISGKQSLALGVGFHSQIQPLEVYFYQTTLPSGQVVQTNQDLDFVKSQHVVLGYDYVFAKNTRIKIETYAQRLYNAAVERNPSSFSMLNAGSDFYFPDKTNLVNDGKGYNYGLELTLERFLSDGYYYLLTTSLFDSKYQGSDGVWRNTAYNTQFISNALAGKEWKLGSRSSFGIDTKVTLAGGQRYTPFDLTASQAAGYVVRQDNEAYSLQNHTYFRWDLKLSYTQNRSGYTQKFYIDFQNLTNQKNLYVRTLNPSSGKITEINQIGFFPNINYSITF